MNYRYHPDAPDAADIAQMRADEPRRFRCAGHRAPYGPCGALDCVACHPENDGCCMACEEAFSDCECEEGPE